MYLLHGENIVKSRNELNQLLQEAKAANREVERIVAKKLNLPELEQLLGNQSLFGTEKTIIIEELHSLPRSKKKSGLIDLLSTASSTQANQLDIILWEKRSLTKTMLKKFPTAKVLAFKASKKIFSLVEQLNPNSPKKNQLVLLAESISSDGDFFVFTMICRQIRMLLEVKDGKRPAGPPFIVAKLQSQAKSFALQKLLKLHAQLTQIDLKLKQSASPLSLQQELDLFIIRM